MSITFAVSEVEQGATRLEAIDVRRAIHRLTTSARQVLSSDGAGRSEGPELQGEARVLCEAWSQIDGGVAEVGVHPLVGAIGLAFDHHLPLELSPDHIWIVLGQGLARHVHLHAEALRHQFVSHEGREIIGVRRDEFCKGACDNDWPGVFEEFSGQLRERIGKRHDLIVADFSTTGPLERAVSQLVLMDAMEKYFEYAFRSACGIPSITLHGSVGDWRSVRERAQVFREFGLDGWIDALTPVLDGFVDAAEGRVDAEHWRSVYKLKSASGGPYITGWVQSLFPYVLDTMSRNVVPNRHLEQWRENMHTPFGGGPCSNELPGAMSSVPFCWQYGELSFEMDFLGGFVGVKQDPETSSVSPQLGWGIRERW